MKDDLAALKFRLEEIDLELSKHMGNTCPGQLHLLNLR